MSALFLRLSLCGVVVAGLAGCGGGSNSGSGGSGGNGGGSESTPTTVTLNISGQVSGVATRIGSDAFISVPISTAPASQTVTLTLPAGETKYSVAVNCDESGNSSNQNEWIFDETTQDMASASVGCGYFAASTSSDAVERRNLLARLDPRSFRPHASPMATAPALGGLSGTVDTSAYPAALGLYYAAYGSNALVAGSQTTTDNSLTLAAPDGSDRVVLWLETDDSVLAAKNFDSQTVPGMLNNGNTVVFGSADAAVSEPISYSSVPSGFSAPTTSVLYAPDGVDDLSFLDIGATTQYAALPAGVLGSGDYYELYASTEAGTVSYEGYTFPTEFVGQAQYAASNGPASFSFPSPWSVPPVTASTTPIFTHNYTGFTGGQPFGSASTISWEYYVQPNFTYVTGQIYEFSSANYLAGQTTLTMPDLSSLTGMLALPPSGTPVLWSSEMENALNYEAGEKTPVGDTFNYAGGNGTYTEP